MHDLTKELSDWMIHFLKHKDLIQNRIQDIKEDGDIVSVKYVDSEDFFLIEPEIKDLNRLWSCNVEDRVNLVSSYYNINETA